MEKRFGYEMVELQEKYELQLFCVCVCIVKCGTDAV